MEAQAQESGVKSMRGEHDVIFVPLGAAAFGGAERSLIELAAAVKQAGLRPLVLCGHALEGTGFDEQARKQDIELRFVDWRPELGAFRNLCASLRAFRTCAAPIIHFNVSWRPWMWMVILSAKAFTRSVLVGSMRAMPDPFNEIRRRRHLGFVPGIGLWRTAARMVGRVWARSLDVTVCVNRNDYPYRLVRDFGFDARSIRVIYNGILPVEATVANEESHHSQRPHSANKVRIAFAGRVSPEKGLDYLLRAVALLPDHFSLTIIGDGEQMPALLTLCADLCISDRVAFLGFQADVYRELRDADIVVVPSIWEEAFGRVVIEAMCLAKPVVATKVGGMAEIFSDGVEGVYVPPRDVSALVEAISRLGLAPELRATMGRSARQRVLADYTLDRVAAQYVDTYRAFVSQVPIRQRLDAAARRLAEGSVSRAIRRVSAAA